MARWIKQANLVLGLALSAFWPGSGLAQQDPVPTDQAPTLERAEPDPLTEPDLEPLTLQDGLPDQFQLAGQSYERQSDPIADQGQFWTDGSRVVNQVVFWEVSGFDKTYSEALSLSDPPPDTLFLLNDERQFIQYQSR